MCYLDCLGNGFPTTNPTDTFHCKDGWFALSIGSDKQWLDFAREAGRDDWGEGSVYAHDPDRSMKHYFGELDQQLKDYFATISIDEADQICRRGNGTWRTLQYSRRADEG